ncbi:MAG: alpha/beta hydrolase [Bacteroidota bacterium]
MKYQINPFFLFACTAFLLLTACDSQDLSQLNEVVYVRHNGADMPAYIHGNGSDKVFLLTLHGGGSFGLALRTDGFREELESRYAVVYWDQRGQAMSQANQSSDSLSVPERAEDVAALVATIKAKYGEDCKLFLLGHSWGGTLGMTYLLQEGAQEQIEGWIMTSGAYDFPLVFDERLDMLQAVIDTFQNQDRNRNLFQTGEWRELKDEFESFSEAEFQEEPELLQPIVRQALSLLVRNNTIEPDRNSEIYPQLIFENNILTWWLNNRRNQPFLDARAEGYALRERLPEIELPILLIWGEYDFSVPPSLGQIALAEVGSSDKTLWILPRSEHFPFLSEADSYFPLVVDFVERLK